MSRVTTIAELPRPAEVRKTILQMLHRASASHLGPCMSMVEILIAIYAHCDIDRIRRLASDRDRVLVSKGHSAAAVYAVMFHFGLIGEAELEGYHSDGSLLAGHVSHAVRCVEHSTGALGHGLAVACGCALGLQNKGESSSDRPLTFAVVGDGELQEGSIWESLMFARHHNLRLLVVVDNNRVSSITRTAEVIDLNPMADRFRGFGLATEEVDGHDLQQLRATISEAVHRPGPSVILANTIKGKGVPFAEHEPVWHYRPLNDEMFAEALSAIEEDSNSLPTE